MISKVKHILRLDDLFSASHTAKPIGSYIYAAFINGECVYIGKGKGARWKHCFTGNGSNERLNKSVEKFHATGINPVQPKVCKRSMKDVLAFIPEAQFLTF